MMFEVKRKNQVRGAQYEGNMAKAGSHAKSLDTVEQFNTLISEHRQRLSTIDPELARNITVISAGLADWVHTPKDGQDIAGHVGGQERALKRQALMALKHAQPIEKDYPGATATIYHVLETLSAASGFDLLDGNYSQSAVSDAAHALQHKMDDMIMDTVTPWGSRSQNVSRSLIEDMLKNTAKLLAARDYYSHNPAYNNEAHTNTSGLSCKYILSNAKTYDLGDDTQSLLQRMSDASGMNLLAHVKTQSQSVEDSQNRPTDTGIPG